MWMSEFKAQVVFGGSRRGFVWAFGSQAGASNRLPTKRKECAALASSSCSAFSWPERVHSGRWRASGGYAHRACGAQSLGNM